MEEREEEEETRRIRRRNSHSDFGPYMSELQLISTFQQKDCVEVKRERERNGFSL